MIWLTASVKRKGDPYKGMFLAENLVNYISMRQLFIFVMAATLGGLGQVPVWASSLFSSNRVECPLSKVRLNCDDMNMDTSRAKLAAPEDTSCCLVTGLPAQELQYVVSTSPSTAMPTATPISFGATPRVWTVPPDIPWHDFSPPASLSRLCTFLI